MNRAIFLDRDGVLNKNVKDLTKPEQFVMLEGVPEAVKRINKSGYLAVIVTNQPIIAKGFCTLGGMERIHQEMNTLLAEGGARIDAIYICPHHPERGFEGEVPELKIECDCRKPEPGLLLKAAQELDIDLSTSWMVGDSPLDVEAGRRAGCKTVFLTEGGGSGARQEAEFSDVVPTLRCRDLKEAVESILSLP